MIRKVGDLSNIQNDIDNALKRLSIKSGETTINASKIAAKHLFFSLLKNRYFDVYSVKSICKVALINISSPRLAIYEAMHCINWGDMEKNFKEELLVMLFDDFRSIF